MEKFSLGDIVISKAGRDMGNSYLISRILDENYVLLVDGKGKSFQNEKRKKTKHLLKTNSVSEEFKEKVEKGETILDAEIKKILKNF